MHRRREICNISIRRDNVTLSLCAPQRYLYRGEGNGEGGDQRNRPYLFITREHIITSPPLPLTPSQFLITHGLLLFYFLLLVWKETLYGKHIIGRSPPSPHTSALLSSSGLFLLQAAAVSSPVSHPRHSTSIYVVGVGCETIAPAIEERDGGGKHPCHEAKRSTEQVCACGQNGSATQTQMLVQASPGGCKRSRPGTTSHCDHATPPGAEEQGPPGGDWSVWCVCSVLPLVKGRCVVPEKMKLCMRFQ